MYSRAHGAIGAVVSAVWLPARMGELSIATAAGLLAYAVAVSVLIDLDHFLLARAYAGDWRHLRRALADPARALWDQAWVLEGLEDLERARLATHAVVGAGLLGGLWLVARDLATFTAVLLVAHVVADLLRDHELL